jgi:hypothetical protein
MKASELIKTLQDLLDVYGDIDVVCPGDHQALYKVGGVERTYVEDIQEYMMEEKHADDVEDFIEDGGRPSKVFVVYG